MNQHRIVGKERRYHPLLINKKQPHHRRYLPEYTRIETEAGGAVFSIRQDWTDARENAEREGEHGAVEDKEKERRRSGNPPTPRA